MLKLWQRTDAHSARKFPIPWTVEQEGAFASLKKSLASPTVLAFPDWNQPFTLHTDASSIGAGAVLTQNHGSREVVIAYASHRFSRTDSKRGPTERECMAVLWGVGHYRQFLAGRRFPFLTGLGVSRLCQPSYLGILGPTLQSYIWRSLPIGRPFLVFEVFLPSGVGDEDVVEPTDHEISHPPAPWTVEQEGALSPASRKA